MLYFRGILRLEIQELNGEDVQKRWNEREDRQTDRRTDGPADSKKNRDEMK